MRLLGSLKRDCRDAEIALHVLPLPAQTRRGATTAFDPRVFYRQLTGREGGTEDGAGAVDIDIETVVERFAAGTRKRRKVATLPLLLPGWRARAGRPGIMLDLYGVVQVRKRPAKVSVHQEQNRCVSSSRSPRAPVRAAALMPVSSPG